MTNWKGRFLSSHSNLLTTHEGVGVGGVASVPVPMTVVIDGCLYSLLGNRLKQVPQQRATPQTKKSRRRLNLNFTHSQRMYTHSKLLTTAKKIQTHEN